MAFFRRRPVVAYFGLTYLLTWVPQIAGYVFARRAEFDLSNEDNLRHLGELFALQLDLERSAIFLLWMVGQFGPLLAALILISVLYGSDGRRDLLQRMARWKVGGRWWALVLAVPILMVTVSLAIAFLTGGLSVGPFQPALPWSAFPLFLLYMVLFTGLPEEPGWRGFALPHLQARFTAARSSWILGIAWGVWHLPFTVYYNLEDPLLILPALVGLTVGIVGWTMVNTWLYNSTSSVLLMILLHGWAGAVQFYFVLSQPNPGAYTMHSVFPWAIAWFLARRYGAEHLSSRTRPYWWPGWTLVETRSHGATSGPGRESPKAVPGEMSGPTR